MAIRSFLLEEEIQEGRRILLTDSRFPENVQQSRRRFSQWLEGRLKARLSEIGNFEELKPLALGSWSRGELCPKSDIDLLLLGDEKKVEAFVREAFKRGLKLRARTPEDPKDWTVGVEPFDILALLGIESQDERVRKNARRILSAVRKEREERRRRQDSVTAYLEPNLKFGVGGLRDIEQAMALGRLFARRFEKLDPYPFQVLATIKEELLFLRALLHLQGSGDILTATDQLEFTKILQQSSHAEFMKFIQSELERASFYGDWVVAVCSTPEKNLVRRQPESMSSALQRLETDPSILTQFEIRRRVRDLSQGLTPFEIGKVVHKALSGLKSDALIVALYRTRLLEVWIPDFQLIRGLVQHDHYHRFTADAHLVQTLREVERARTRSRSLGRLGRLTRELSATDWWILKLTALFHDLAKGRGGDHSTKGAELVHQYLSEWNYPEAIKEDVSWLVANHLILSSAAFRQNPQAESTWKRLFERGVEGRRLALLALFTAIDIRATNPEAWNEWKSQLLWQLVENLRSKRAMKLQGHLRYVRRHNAVEAVDWILNLDPAILEILTPKVLLEDLHEAATSQTDLPVRVISRVKTKGRFWVRIHRKRDEPGIFLDLVSRFFGLGLSIQTACVHTLSGVGVYDWFCVRNEKSARQIALWLNQSNPPKPFVVPDVTFQTVELVAEDENEWIFSFRGKDTRGLLLAAADALANQGLSLNWARAHTWGQQVDDIFSVRPLGEVNEVLQSLKNRFVT